MVCIARLLESSRFILPFTLRIEGFIRNKVENIVSYDIIGLIKL